jgi:hypothetical protein
VGYHIYVTRMPVEYSWLTNNDTTIDFTLLHESVACMIYAL